MNERQRRNIVEPTKQEVWVWGGQPVRAEAPSPLEVISALSAPREDVPHVSTDEEVMAQGQKGTHQGLRGPGPWYRKFQMLVNLQLLWLTLGRKAPQTESWLQ